MLISNESARGRWYRRIFGRQRWMDTEPPAPNARPVQVVVRIKDKADRTPRGKPRPKQPAPKSPQLATPEHKLCYNVGCKVCEPETDDSSDEEIFKSRGYESEAATSYLTTDSSSEEEYHQEDEFYAQSYYPNLPGHPPVYPSQALPSDHPYSQYQVQQQNGRQVYQIPNERMPSLLEHIRMHL